MLRSVSEWGGKKGESCVGPKPRNNIGALIHKFFLLSFGFRIVEVFKVLVTSRRRAFIMYLIH